MQQSWCSAALFARPKIALSATDDTIPVDPTQLTTPLA
jgi:hypothetical protein